MKSALMLGVNPNTVRQKEDFYATEPKIGTFEEEKQVGKKVKIRLAEGQEIE